MQTALPEDINLALAVIGLDQRAGKRDPGSTRSFLEGIGGRQPSDAAPDDDDVWRVLRTQD
jgi:hypothetical protein